MMLSQVFAYSICIVLAVTGFPHTVRGPELVYTFWEPAEGESKDLPPIIFIHGIGGSRTNWNDIAPRFVKETGRKAYAFDTRDHGDSPWTDNPSNHEMTEDINDFMDSHNIPKATLVGHSLGGRTTMSMAVIHPEKVEKIVIEDVSNAKFTPQAVPLLLDLFTLLEKAAQMVPSGLDERQAKIFIYEYLKDILPNSFQAPKNLLFSESDFADLSIFQLYTETNSDKLEENLKKILIRKENGRYIWKTNFKALTKALKEGKFDNIPQGTYDGEALFVYGGKSIALVDHDEDIIKKQFPKASLVEFPDAGHDIHIRFPDVYLEKVSKFINA